MARPKEFDVDVAIAAAVEVFKERGFEGTSAQMLVDAMKIGRQSLYDTFGDKWGVYVAALKQYTQLESKAHREMLASGHSGIDSLKAMFSRVAENARSGCLGVCSMVEFGTTKPELVGIWEAAGTGLDRAIADAVTRAQTEGDIDVGVDPARAVTFLTSTITGMRVAARAGADPASVAAIGDFALKGLR